MSTVQLGDTQWHYGAVDLPKQQTPGSKILTILFVLITDWLSKTLWAQLPGLKLYCRSTY
ncbi:transposase [Vibrio crassostreae]|nr:transposase [Vibrio crassostreae]CAK3684382.1 transposase [Vibrio crassostreae]